jgi:hypothetical protein
MYTFGVFVSEAAWCPDALPPAERSVAADDEAENPPLSEKVMDGTEGIDERVDEAGDTREVSRGHENVWGYQLTRQLGDRNARLDNSRITQRLRTALRERAIRRHL